jgi:hypothetical protein
MMIPLNINLGGRNKMPNGAHALSKGVKIYVKDGNKHRISGPAEVHPDGYQAWFKQGLRHRVGGPAVIYPDGREEYWENGKLIKNSKKEDFNGRSTRGKEKAR